MSINIDTRSYSRYSLSLFWRWLVGALEELVKFLVLVEVLLAGVQRSASWAFRADSEAARRRMGGGGVGYVLEESWERQAD